ncbi:hypothetical protein ACFYYB_35130 [Streptomyces sp. NPDC002886]|uniref:hypothetical protein n=1 Tax=Streptomyces sp. NPDC002886 TaxID=3364667 RepID=UPI00369A5051
MAFRYRCGECGFKPSWGTESQNEREQIEHYADRHPGLHFGGTVEANAKSPEGGIGCLGVLGVPYLLFLIAAACSR